MNSMAIEFEKNEIKRNIENLEVAENRKSIEGMLELVTEDFLIVLHGAIFTGKTVLGEMLKESAKNFISSKHVPSRIEVSSSGDMAWVFGVEINKRERNSEIIETKQYYILIFRKEDGQWKQAAVCIA